MTRRSSETPKKSYMSFRVGVGLETGTLVIPTVCDIRFLSTDETHDFCQSLSSR